MAWRLRLLTTVILVLFAAGAWLYFRLYVNPSPHGVILFIAPGITAAEVANALNHEGEPATASFPQALDVSLVSHGSYQVLGNLSSLSTGTNGPANTLGLTQAGNPSDNLTYLAQRSGRTIGLVTGDRFTHPAAAAFYAHTDNPQSSTDVVLQLLDSTEWNVLLGGERAALDPMFPRDESLHPLPPAQSRNLIEEARLNGFRILDHPEGIEEIPEWRTRQLMGAFHFPDAFYDPEGHSHSPTLTSMVALAIECLQFSVRGYFLVTVTTDVSVGPEANNSEFRTANLLQLGKALNTACDYSDKNTVILLYLPGQSNSPGHAILFRGKHPLPPVTNPIELHQYLKKCL